MSVENARVPEVAPGHAITRIVDGSGFRTVNGIAFGPDGRLCAASMMGESVFALDLATGAIETVVGPFAGESDDLVFTPAGDLIWTAVPEGAVRMRTADGRIREIDLAGSAPSRLVTDHTGGLNAFRFGPDGMICAPSWNRGQVVCIDLESGHTTVLAEGFGRPGGRAPRLGRVALRAGRHDGRAVRARWAGGCVEPPPIPARAVSPWARTGPSTSPPMSRTRSTASPLSGRASVRKARALPWTRQGRAAPGPGLP